METHFKKAVLLSGNNKESQGTLDIERLSRAARIKKAIFLGILGLVITTVLVAIPLLHFILVPLGLLATAIMVGGALNAKEKITGGDAQCPYCGFSFHFVKRKMQFPFLERCPECSRESTVTPLHQASEPRPLEV